MTDLQRGDLFGVKTEGIGGGIRFFEKLWSSDNKAEYNHSGLILDSEGTTFEALWKVKKQNLYERYAGCKVVVARWEGNTVCPVDQALERIITEYENKWYPAWRIPLHTIPFLAKINFSGLAVCSELAAKYEWYLGIRHDQWAGTNPDTLSDEWHKWDGFRIVFEDVV